MVSLDDFLAKAGGKARVYKNFRLNTAGALTDKVILVIPDTHLLEKGATDDFLDPQRAEESLGKKTAFEERFLDLLDFLLQWKSDMKDALEIVQLGDMYDLWQARGNTNMIESRYTSILGLMDELQSVYIVGNHDMDLWNFKKDAGKFARKWRHFSSPDVSKATIMFEHGFQADFFNNQARWSGVIGKVITEIIGVMEYINPDIDVQLGNLWDNVSRAFSIYNAGLTPVKNPEGFNTHEYIGYYVDTIAKYRRGETDDHQQTPNLVCAVIGHTHQARLVTRAHHGETLYLMDCGSWVNGGHEFGIITGSELAVCQWG